MAWHPKKNPGDCKSRRLYGRHPVHEHLRAVPQSVREVYLLPSGKGGDIEQEAGKWRVPVRYESPHFLHAYTEGGVHQGVAARLDPFPYVSLQSLTEKEAAPLLILDQVLDPRNLGALLRTAAAAGVGGVILPERHASPITPLVEKVAAGATAYLPICRAENLARALVALKGAGYWTIGLAPEAQQMLYDLEVPQKVALLLGGEEKGLRPLTRKNCDFLVSIPMPGEIPSLNVSVAGAVAVYELLRRKREQEKLRP